jgi:hypothetical protein
MEGALFGDEPLKVFKTVRCFLVFNFNFILFRGIAGCPFVCFWGNPLAIVPKF